MNNLECTFVQGFGSPVVRRHNTDKDDLENYVRLLRSARSLTELINKGQTLSRDGKNILHLIAAERDFASYEDLLKKCCEDSRFISLLTQAPESAETPLHVLCTNGNFPMLNFLISIPDERFSAPEMHPKYWLNEMGRVKLKATQNNAFHCLCQRSEPSEGRTVLQDTVLEHHAYRTQMFEMLVKLFGDKEAVALASEKNGAGQTLLDLSKASGNTELIQKVTELFAANWRQLNLEQATYISQ